MVLVASLLGVQYKEDRNMGLSDHRGLVYRCVTQKTF